MRNVRIAMRPECGENLLPVGGGVPVYKNRLRTWVPLGYQIRGAYVPVLYVI